MDSEPLRQEYGTGGGSLTGIRGVVKWFDQRKGYGFIVGPAGQDIFAHYSRIVGDGFRVLQDGIEVEYDAECGAKGWCATRIVRAGLVPSRGVSAGTDAGVHVRSVARPRTTEPA